MPAQRPINAWKIGIYGASFGLSRNGNTVPSNACSSAVHAETRIATPFSCAPRALIAVKSSSRTGSRITACVSSAPCASAIEIAWVPGSFEIPLAADRLARSGQFAAVICLGAVIRGETTHDRYINHAVSHFLMAFMIST